MSDYEVRDRRRVDTRSESPSSRERGYKGIRYRSQDTDGRKRYRSRSRDHYDRPRKRRSLSPSTIDHERHSRRSREPNRHHRSRSRSPHRRKRGSQSPKSFPKSKSPLPPQDVAFRKNDDTSLEKPVDKQKPNFGNSGKLAAASNTIQTAGQTIVLKYHEPAEARKPPAKDQWRLYVFKDDEIVETIELSEQSCWLFGREAAVVDCFLEHPSTSKQHAVIQFRYIEKRNEFGDKIGRVRPYVIDLESANGTSVNNDQIPVAKYLELRDKDAVKFGHSSREYVIQLPPR